MTANPPPTGEPRPTPQLDPREVELRELAAQFPEHSHFEWAKDREWLNEEMRKGSMDSMYGKVVAVYKKQVIGVGDDYIAMLLELSKQYNVHPGRIVTVFLGE